MQVTETLSEGLKRELRVVVPAAELDSRLATRLDELRQQVRINGFRPGKVPIGHLRKLYGRAAMAEIVQQVLNETTRQTLEERGERPAAPPNYDLPEDEGEAEKVLKGEADFAYSMSYEVLPEFELADFKGIAVERPVIELDEAEVEGELAKVAEAVRPYEPKEGPAEEGDRVRVSYVGRIDGAPFEGGSNDDVTVRLGAGEFLADLEKALFGVAAGEEKTAEVSFPQDYPAEQVAGKTAQFEVKVLEVLAPGPVEVNEGLAERLGMESLEKVREAVRGQLSNRDANAVRQRIRRQLLDRLDDLHKFDLPASLVDQEFENIWRQITAEMERSGRSFADEDTTEEAAREEYRKIAERRVRLGLVLAEIGQRNQITVSEEELQRGLRAQLRQFPGREQELYGYYQKNPDALAALRAPIFEEKVVDFLLELADVTDKPMSREELERLEEQEGKAGTAEAGEGTKA